MTFTSQVDLRTQEQESFVGYDPLLHGESSFGDTFGASVGVVIDEEMSISSLLNNEMYAQREAIVGDMAGNGVDLTPYTDADGAIDYNRLAIEMPYDGLKTDRQLYDERNLLLEKRRTYGEDVIERGSGMAQFTGSMSGYMLDPVNVATLPIGASASALRGLGTLARIGRVAATEAVVGASAELLIQPFVYQHKNEIGSPYTVGDSVTAIATAALGGAAIGGAATGAAGFLRRIAKIADDYPSDPGAIGSKQILERVASDMEANPERGVVSETIGREARHFFTQSNEDISLEIVALKRVESPSVEQQIRLEAAQAVFESRKGRWSKKVESEISAEIDAERLRLADDEKTRLSRGERKRLSKDLQDLRTQRNAIKVAEPDVVKTNGVSARKAKADATARVEAEANTARAGLDEQITAIESRLEASKTGEQARADLSRVQQGIYSKRLQESLNQIEHKRMVEVDTEYLRKLEETRTATASKKAVPENYGVEAEPTYRNIDEYDAEDLARYEALGEDGVVWVDGDAISAKGFIDERSAEIDGLNDVMVCGIG